MEYRIEALAEKKLMGKRLTMPFPITEGPSYEAGQVGERGTAF